VLLDKALRTMKRRDVRTEPPKRPGILSRCHCLIRETVEVFRFSLLSFIERYTVMNLCLRPVAMFSLAGRFALGLLAEERVRNG